MSHPPNTVDEFRRAIAAHARDDGALNQIINDIRTQERSMCAALILRDNPKDSIEAARIITSEQANGEIVCIVEEKRAEHFRS